MHNKIIKLIKEYDNIVIYRHARPDGDALGSQMGLKEIIRDNFPSKKVFAIGDTTPKYDFIGQVDCVDEQIIKKSLCFVLDCSEQSLISDKSYINADKIIKIDHHIQRESFGDIEIVDDSYESCCGLVADLFYKMHLKINKIAAQALYTGIVTDSGRFRYDSTTTRTFNICAKLLSENFDMQKIYQNLYVEDLENILLRARYTLKMKFTKNNVAYIMTTKDEVELEKTDIFTISRSIVNTMSGIKNIDIWVNFTEDINGAGVFVEIRSNKYNINPIAVKYGGGGHAKASGATVKNFDVALQLLDDLDKLSGGNNE